MLDIDAIRRAHPLPTVVGASVKLTRQGSEFKACCPFHADRSPSFTIYAGGQRFQCFGCGKSGDVLDFVRLSKGVGLREAAELLSSGTLPAIQIAAPPVDRNPAQRLEEARSIWRAASPARGTLAEAYLRSRGLHLPIPESIRFAQLRYGRRGPLHPVLVAVVANANDQFIGIQRTYLNASGTGKAAVAKAKLNLGSVTGGAMRLAPAARVMMIAEGLEDGLTLQQEFGRATWVSAGAGNLSSMILPAGVEAVTIGGDADDTGRSAAAKAVDTFTRRGIRARAIFPLEGKDFNAELQARACK